MKNFPVIVLFFFLAGTTFAQSTTDTLRIANPEILSIPFKYVDFHSGLQLFIPNLFFREIKLNYLYEHDDDLYFETAFGYRYPSRSAGDKMLGIKLEEDYWIYEKIVFQAGLRKYIEGKRIFFGPMIDSRYSNFDNKLMPGYEKEFTSIVSRKRYEIGGMIKIGTSHIYTERYIIDFYIGAGGVFRQDIDSILCNFDSNNKVVEGKYPYLKVKSSIKPTVQLGVMLGLIFY